MKVRIVHILISAVLTIAVTDYVWAGFSQKQTPSAWLESDGNSESEQNLKEAESSGKLAKWIDGDWFLASGQFILQQQTFGLLQLNPSFGISQKNRRSKLFILYHQLRIHC